MYSFNIHMLKVFINIQIQYIWYNHTIVELY